MSGDDVTRQALDLVSSLVLEDGRRWGEAATRWQWQDARAVLDVQGPSPYQFLTRPRGGSKTSDLAAVAIAVMLIQAPLGARLYALAADRDQGRLLLDSIEGFIRRTPELGSLLDMTAFRVTARETGVRLEVLSADAASAWPSSTGTILAARVIGAATRVSNASPTRCIENAASVHISQASTALWPRRT